MENNRREVKIIAIVALLVAVVGLSVAYAALSTSLTISGTATINSASWNVAFVPGTGTPTGGASFTEPTTVTATTISGMNITLTKPGDKVEYLFSVTNTGTIDAKLASIQTGNLETGGLVCTGVDSAEASSTCGNLTFKYTYADGSAISAGDLLNSTESRQLLLSVEFNESATVVPQNPITVTGVSATMVYEQAD